MKVEIKVLKMLAKRNRYLVRTIEHRELRGFNCRYLVMNDQNIVGAYNNLMDILRDYEEEEVI